MMANADQNVLAKGARTEPYRPLARAADARSPFYILSVDGGGFRGLFAAHLLTRMEEEWHVDWLDRFSLFAGTSTGSILAAGLACGVSASQMRKSYVAHAAGIFTPRLQARLDRLGLFTSRYSNSKLRDLLEEAFGAKTLGQVGVPLILPAVDIDNGCVHVFKSSYAASFVRDSHIRVADAVLASCSAPTYFDPHTVGEYHLVDGGLWANNPSLLATIDAHHRLGVRLDDVRVLSIGTGTSKAFYPRSDGKWRDRWLRSWQGWGVATRWQRSKLVDLILNLQSANVYNTLRLLLGHDPSKPAQILRLTFESDRPLPMDSTNMKDDWIARADYTFVHNAEKIAEFLSTPGAVDERE